MFYNLLLKKITKEGKATLLTEKQICIYDQ